MSIDSIDCTLRSRYKGHWRGFWGDRFCYWEIDFGIGGTEAPTAPLELPLRIIIICEL